jgi:hypothetical protein
MARKGKKRIFTTDEITQKSLVGLAKQMNLTVTDILLDAGDLLNRLMFVHKCDAGVQFDNRFDKEIYQLILARYYFPNEDRLTKAFKHRLKEIKKRAIKSGGDNDRGEKTKDN